MGPRPIATGRRDQVQWSQLLMYIRLPDAARYFVAECFGQVSISAIVDGKRKDLISLNK
jgi:hypothetical protein